MIQLKGSNELIPKAKNISFNIFYYLLSCTLIVLLSMVLFSSLATDLISLI